MIRVSVLLILLFFSTGYCIKSQEPLEVNLSKARIIEDVYTLASDSMRGRKFPDVGREKAALYIAGQFQKAGLRGINYSDEPYFQKIPVTRVDKGQTVINVNDTSYKSGFNFSFASTTSLDDSLSIPVKFIGYSLCNTIGNTGEDTLIYFLAHNMIDARERLEELVKITGAKYFGFSIKEESRLLSRFFPGEVSLLINNERSLSLYQYPEGVFGMGATGDQDWLYDYLPENGNDIGVFLFDDYLFEKFFDDFLVTKHRSSLVSFKSGELPEVFVRELNFKTSFRLIEITKKDDNIIGYIEGTDLKDEVIIICGHYDHLGKSGDDIYYGADDNASGSAAVMELSRMFMQAKANGMDFRRTIVFIAFGAEETGLNGSLYYVNNPVFPLDKTVLVINLDMIGRSEQVNDRPGLAFVYPLQGLKRPVWRVFRNTGRQVESINLERIRPSIRSLMYYAGSDHYPFARSGVPAVSVNTGLHPDYHKPTDIPEKINYDNLADIIKIVFVVAAKVANDPKNFPVN